MFASLIEKFTGCCFFFQAEDGIRDYKVTGVQTCALPISSLGVHVRCSLAPKSMTTTPSHLARASVLGALLLAAPGTGVAQTVDYQRAEQLLTWNAMRNVTGDQVAPAWYRDSTRFWYRVMTARGPEFVTVNPTTGARSLLFDNGRLAAALSLAADTAVVGSKLPFQTVTFENEGRDEQRIRVRLGKRGFTCDRVGYTCAAADTLPVRTRYVRSPDERWDAFASGNNLWVRKVGATDSIQLTTDGADGYAYGVGSPSPTQVRRKLPSVPPVTWSPDSKKLVVPRIDERGVEKFVLYSSTSSRPTYYLYPYALPGDSIVQTYVNYVIDIATRTSKRIEGPAQPLMSFYAFGGRSVQWSPSSDRIYYTRVDRGPKHVQLMAVDANGNAPCLIIADSSKTYVIGGLELIGGPTNWRPLKNGDVIWVSQRRGSGPP